MWEWGVTWLVSCLVTWGGPPTPSTASAWREGEAKKTTENRYPKYTTELGLEGEAFCENEENGRENEGG